MTLGNLFHEEHPLAAHVPFEAEPVYRVLTELLASERGCLLVAEERHPSYTEIVGALAGVIGTTYFNHTVPIAQELAWFIHPKRRGSTLAFRLFLAFEEWAASCGAQVLMVSAFTPQVDALYRSSGYTYFESCFVKGAA